MTGISETRINAGDHLELPVAQMQPWFFWARTRTIKCSKEEFEACTTGTLTEKQRKHMVELMNAALMELRDAPVPGVDDFMSARRRSC